MTNPDIARDPEEDDGAIHIWTVQVPRHRMVRRMGIHFLDITAKSGVQAFAPEFRQVMRYKNGEINELEYTRLYDDRMEYSLVNYPEMWAKLKEHRKVALACYCAPNTFCHRRLFSTMMKNYLQGQGLQVVEEGELIPPPPPPEVQVQCKS